MSQSRRHQSSPDDENTSNYNGYPDFVAYHFVSPDGELLAMEEDGASTVKILQQGLSIDGSSVGFAKVERSDVKLIPEKESYQMIQAGNWQQARFLAHLVTEQGAPHPLDPRSILKRQVDRAHQMGYEPYMFSEVEFYLVDRHNQQPVDQATYCSLPPHDTSYQFRRDLGTICKQLGMQVKRIHHEVGPGQNEMELNLTPCSKNADDTLLAMLIMKLLADANQQDVIFTPKPFPDQPGSGLHHHILLRDMQTGDNVFFDTNTDDNLSKICKHGIAGLLHFAADITAVFAASPESFQRLEPGFEAPIYQTWGLANRTALVRVPETPLDKTRFEYRGGDLSGSVHLFGAVLLAAVLEGIQEEMTCPPPIVDNLETLLDQERQERNILAVPLSFQDCIVVLKSSRFLRTALGEDMVQHLIERNQELLPTEIEIDETHTILTNDVQNKGNKLTNTLLAKPQHRYHHQKLQ